ncbi:hypothetical protein HW555_012224 [Spodoptera exigua]|uniref:Uncharacterized protein n=1 Tax=Spodoptera exigua TaxID=7107 RepID=A0A835G7X4_SPOEX|nr:hypothetical protein HW555_012224 [Spodoptera exigua]
MTILMRARCEQNSPNSPTASSFLSLIGRTVDLCSERLVAGIQHVMQARGRGRRDVGARPLAQLHRYQTQSCKWKTMSLEEMP